MAYLKSTTAYIYDKLNAPVGTKMVFNQTTSPLGWTKETGSNDVSLRLVSGTVGTGGTVAFETCFASQTVPTHTLSSSQIASHAHQTVASGEWYVQSGSGGGSHAMGSGPYTQPNLTSSNTGAIGGGAVHGHGSVDLNVSYVDVIIATKA